MNVVDRTIELFSPGAALRREQARMSLTALRKYEAATVGRRTADWKAGGGSANVEILQGLAVMRNRSRQMVRDNEYAKRGVHALVTGIVGTGITVIPELKSERDLWARWSQDECDADGQLDLAGIMRLAALSWKEGGEALLRRRWRRPEDGLSVPMQVQLLEPDHLDHQKTRIDGDFIDIAGVRFDKLGRRVGYWLFPMHPGEVVGLRGGMQSVLVPASEITHLYRKDRISQVRGVPELAVSLMRLRDLDGYEEAELVRKKIESCFTAMVTTDQPRMTIGQLAKENDGATGKGGRVVEKVSPGLIKYLSQGESVTFGTPAAVGGYGEYTATQLHAIAAGIGVTYPQLTGDTSRSNYTSNRAGLREFFNLVDAEQWLTFIPMFVRPIRRWWREAAQLNGTRIGSKPDRITTPRKAMVDPLKDTLADKEEIRAGLATLSEKLRERGIDPESFFAESKSERDLIAKLQLVFDTDAAVTDLKLAPTDVLGLDAKQE